MCDVKNFLTYKSSAGSGKTYTLVKAYLKIVLLHPLAIKRILAITFTNAAAAEMKGRIILELGKLSQLGTDISDHQGRSLLEQITTEWQEEGIKGLSEEQIIHNARLALKTILHQYGEFSVSTIDSFVHRVIRSFAFDLFLPFHFDVELDALHMLSKATDILISRAGSDEALTRLLISFILDQLDEEKDLRIEKLLIDMGKTLIDEEGTEAITSLKEISPQSFMDVYRQIRHLLHNYEKQTRHSAREALSLIADSGLTAGDFFRGSGGLAGYFEKVQTPPFIKKIEPGKTCRSTIEEDKWSSSKASRASKDAINNIKERLTEIYQSITGENDENINRYRTYRAVAATLFPVALLSELDRTMEEMKEKELVLHISDFNKKIASIVTEQPIPFIYERLGERYQHYMIDEFQDTSALQWQNLLPLIDNALANGHRNLIVGDGKQAIYRFRNGDVAQFTMLPHLSSEIRSPARADWEQTLINNYSEKSLDTNFRSRDQIVQFNNDFFTHAREFLDNEFRSVYSHICQKSLDTKPGGYVEIVFLDPKNEGHKVAGDTGEASSGLSYEEATLSQLVDCITALTESGHAPADIAILCRANDKASLIARHLLKNNIPVISSESLLLSHSHEVAFLIAMLKLINNQYDQLAMAEIVNYLYHTQQITHVSCFHACLTEAGLYGAPSHEEKKPFTETLEELLKKNGIDLHFSSFVHQNMFDVCESLIQTFFSGDEPPSPFVAFFSDALFDYTDKNELSIADFLSWWETNSKKYSLVVPEGLNAVRVTTIHKSKGLQFPVVILPFADSPMTRLTKDGQWMPVDLPEVPTLKTTWIGLGKEKLKSTPFESCYDQERNKSYLDALNILYVAFTRAEEKLFIMSRLMPSAQTDNTSGILRSYLEHKGFWDDQQLCYAFGQREMPGESRESRQRQASAGSGLPASVSFSNIASFPWNRRLRMRSHQIERSTAAGTHDHLERGNLLHRAMEKIMTAADIDPILDQMHANGEIDGLRKEEWAKKILSLIGHPDIEECYKPGVSVKPEAGIFDKDGKYYRPDRVVLTREQTTVIDYKTGKEYGKHQHQMETYARLLSEMGYPRVKKILLYLDENKIIAG